MSNTLEERAGRFSLSGISNTPLDNSSESGVPSAAEQKIADDAARKSGFVSREPEPVLNRSRKPEASRPVTVRMSVSYANRLVKYCDENRFTYGQLFEKLMDENNI